MAESLSSESPLELQPPLEEAASDPDCFDALLNAVIGFEAYSRPASFTYGRNPFKTWEGIYIDCTVAVRRVIGPWPDLGVVADGEYAETPPRTLNAEQHRAMEKLRETYSQAQLDRILDRAFAAKLYPRIMDSKSRLGGLFASVTSKRFRRRLKGFLADADGLQLPDEAWMVGSYEDRRVRHAVDIRNALRALVTAIDSADCALPERPRINERRARSRKSPGRLIAKAVAEISEDAAAPPSALVLLGVALGIDDPEEDLGARTERWKKLAQRAAKDS